VIAVSAIRRRLGSVVLTAFAIGSAAFAQTAPTPGAASSSQTGTQLAGEWHNYAADSRSSKYSPLDQIDGTNVHQLEIAWRWKSIDYGLAARHEGVVPPFVFQNTPMMRDGRVLVATGIGAAALDPATGEILWTYDPFEDEEPRNMGRLSVRGGVTWNDGATRRLFFNGNGRLTALDADTGGLDPDFGDGGRIDMLDAGQGVRRRQYFWTSAPVVCGDVIVLGESTSDAWSRRRNPPGMIRGYNARTGALRWRFNIIPEPDEFGFDTWESAEAAQAGAANVWTWMSCDQELGMVYAATSTPSNDWYGGHRPGKGLFAESILALDAERRTSVVLPGRPPRPLGLRLPGPAGARRHRRRRHGDQGAGPAFQAGVPLRLRPGDRRSGLADRRTARATVRCAR